MQLAKNELKRGYSYRITEEKPSNKYLILMITSRANGMFSRMPSPADEDPLDYKTADFLLAKDQHGNYQGLDQKAVPPILLLDCIVYKGGYVTRV